MVDAIVPVLISNKIRKSKNLTFIIYYMLMKDVRVRVCVCVCVCVRARVRACVCMCIISFTQVIH